MVDVVGVEGRKVVEGVAGFLMCGLARLHQLRCLARDGVVAFARPHVGAGPRVEAHGLREVEVGARVVGSHRTEALAISATRRASEEGIGHHSWTREPR